MFSTWAYAGIISYDDIISANDVQISWLNGEKNTIYQQFNGHIDGINISSNTISDDNLTPSIKMQNWYSESIGDWTYSGHLPATSANLTSDISAGTSYVKGKRITTSSTSKTYTASKDTWVYIDSNGAFQYVEVALGAAQPTSPANSLLLAKVVTGGVAITSVVDHRQLTPPNLRVYQNYRQGCIVSYDTVSTIKINPGEIELGSTSSAGRRKNSSAISLAWTDIDVGAEAASTLYFVWAYPDPNNSTNFLGKISVSSTDAVGISNERLAGWFWNDSSSNITADCVTTSYKGDGSGVPNVVRRVGNTDVSTTAYVSFVDLPDMETVFYSSGRPITLYFQAPFSDSLVSGNVFCELLVDNITKDATMVDMISDGTAGAQGQSASMIWVETFGIGLHTAKVRWRGEGTSFQHGSGTGARVLIVKEE
jgi:hypothetical protein